MKSHVAGGLHLWMVILHLTQDGWKDFNERNAVYKLSHASRIRFVYVHLVLDEG